MKISRAKTIFPSTMLWIQNGPNAEGLTTSLWYYWEVAKPLGGRTEWEEARPLGVAFKGAYYDPNSFLFLSASKSGGNGPPLLPQCTDLLQAQAVGPKLPWPIMQTKRHLCVSWHQSLSTQRSPTNFPVIFFTALESFYNPCVKEVELLGDPKDSE